MKKLCSRGLAALLALMLLAACGAPAGESPSSSQSAPEGEAPVPAEEAGYELYSLYRDGTDYFFDGEGNLLAPEDAYTVLCDLATGEEKYLLYTRTEDTGEDDEWGGPVTMEYSRLCGLDGSVIQDWEPMAYDSAMGGLVIRREARNPYEIIMPGTEVEAALWDPAAGEAVVEGVDSLQSLNNGHFLALDPSGMALGVLDGEGNILSGFPAPGEYFYPITEDGRILADLYNPYGEYDEELSNLSRLMDEDFNVLLEGEGMNISFIGLRGDFLLVDGEDGTTREVRSLEDFSLLYSWDESTDDTLEYFDGELMILRTGERGSWQYALTTPEGEVVAGGFDQLTAEDDMSMDASGPAQTFVGRKGDTILRLDREGNTLAQADFPGLDSIYPLGDGYTSYTLAAPEADSGETSYFEISSFGMPTGMLDPALSVVIPAEKYDNVYRLSQWDGSRSTDLDLFQCSREVNGSYRMDIVDTSGRVLLDSLTSTSMVQDGKLAVIRGFSMGLMDLSGNWISQYSIYDGLNDE